jgi:DNA-directed RNA polymerase specialized sigma24 family protein
MKKQWDTTQEGFDRLLSWLAEDRDEAGRKYEIIRHRLIKIFTCRDCAEAEDLADETISRVTAKVPEIAATYEGDPALFFYGVAKKLHHEYLRRQNRPTPPVMPDATSDDEDPMYECLDGCMGKLPEKTRELVLRYYQNEKKLKIASRKSIADELGIGVNALRIRAHRIRLLLRKCVQDCIEQLPVN